MYVLCNYIYIYIYTHTHSYGAWVSVLVGRSRDRLPVVSLGIFSVVPPTELSVVPPTEPCALRSTQPLKMSTRDFSWDKVGRCIWLKTYHPCSAETSRKSGVLTYPEPPWATSVCRGTPLLISPHVCI